jgi:hypothetical protein
VSIGDAIFLSALLLSLVGLYAATKDRWNWKRIAKWAIAAPFALALVLWGSSWIYSKFQERPTLQTEFEGLRLGATEADVLFLKGEPARRPRGEQWVFHAKPSSADPERALVIVGFRDGKVRYVTYWENDLLLDRPYLLGFTIGSDYAAVIERLGQPSNVSISSDSLTRVASFGKYNAVFEFEKGRVTRIGIFDNTTGPIRLSNEASQASSAPK